jgi:phage terminase large subunit-like protein
MLAGMELTGAANKSLRHSGHGLMAWAVPKRARRAESQRYHHHQVPGLSKIDPLMAAFNAIA